MFKSIILIFAALALTSVLATSDYINQASDVNAYASADANADTNTASGISGITDMLNSVLPLGNIFGGASADADANANANANADANADANAVSGITNVINSVLPLGNIFGGADADANANANANADASATSNAVSGVTNIINTVLPSGFGWVPSGVYTQAGSNPGRVTVNAAQGAQFLFSGLGSSLSCTVGSVASQLMYHLSSGLCTFQIPNLQINNLCLNVLDAVSVQASVGAFNAIYSDNSFSGTIKVTLDTDVLPVLGNLGFGNLFSANIDLVLPLSLSLLPATAAVPDCGC